MATPPIHTHPDFQKWSEFYNKKRHLNIYSIAKQAVDKFGGSRNTWTNRFNAIQQIAQRNKLKQHHEKKDEAFLEYIGKPLDYKEPKKQWAKKTDKTKVLVVSDPHEPYSSKAVWDEVLLMHKDAYHIHINGDIADFYSKSRFRKTEHVNFDDELRVIFERLEWLSTHWEKVTLIRGNHDNRAEKRMALLVDSDMLFLTEQDVLSYMCAYFSNVEVVGERVISEGNEVGIDFLWQLNDVIFTHIERSQKQSSALLDGISSQLHKWGRTFGFKPYRVIIQAHNHRATFDANGSEYLYLCPMAANLATTGLKYALSPMMGGNPPVVGYMELYQVDGVTQINKTKMRIFDNI